MNKSVYNMNTTLRPETIFQREFEYETNSGAPYTRSIVRSRHWTEPKAKHWKSPSSLTTEQTSFVYFFTLVLASHSVPSFGCHNKTIVGGSRSYDKHTPLVLGNGARFCCSGLVYWCITIVVVASECYYSFFLYFRRLAKFSLHYSPEFSWIHLFLCCWHSDFSILRFFVSSFSLPQWE